MTEAQGELVRLGGAWVMEEPVAGIELGCEVGSPPSGLDFEGTSVFRTGGAVVSLPPT